MGILIPLRHMAGDFAQEQLAPDSASLRLTLTDYGMLQYQNPAGGWETNIYNVPKSAVLTAHYAEDGALSEIFFMNGDKRRYVYFARPDLSAFAAETAPQLAERLLAAAGEQEVSRLFFEYFYDGEAADFAVKFGTPADMDEIRARYSADTDATDNSGDYPSERRFPCDTALFSLMLRCAPLNTEGLFDAAVKSMMVQIRERVLPQLHKTEDFRVIAEEYD